MTTKPTLNQIAVFGPLTYQIGRVSAIRSNGFYIRVKNAYPKVPGGREYGYHSVFFTFDQIGPNGYSNTNDSWLNKTAQVTLSEDCRMKLAVFDYTIPRRSQIEVREALLASGFAATLILSTIGAGAASAGELIATRKGVRRFPVERMTDVFAVLDNADAVIILAERDDPQVQWIIDRAKDGTDFYWHYGEK
jgi:hypothetical protein